MTNERDSLKNVLKDWEAAEEDDFEPRAEDGDIWGIKKLAQAKATLAGIPVAQENGGVRRTGETGRFQVKKTDPIGVKLADLSLNVVAQLINNPASQTFIANLDRTAKSCLKADLHSKTFLDLFDVEKTKAGPFLQQYLQDLVRFISAHTVVHEKEDWKVEIDISNPDDVAKLASALEIQHHLIPICSKATGKKESLSLYEILATLRYF